MNVLQQLGDLIVIMVTVGLALYGWQHGLFLATLAGIQVLASVLAALACADSLQPLLVQMECPEAYAHAVAFLVILIAGLLVTRLAIGGGVPEGAVRFSPLIDRTGGTLMGAFAGLLLAGTILIAWSMAPLPESMRLAGTKLKLDVGSPLLRTAARWFGDDEIEERLLAAYRDHTWNETRDHGEEGAPVATPSPEPPPDESSAEPAL